MKRLLLLLASLALTACATAPTTLHHKVGALQGPIPVNQLPAASITNGTDLTICDQTGSTRACTMSQVASYVANAIGIVGSPANGQLLIGNGSGLSLNTLTAGSNITITNGAGQITIAATGGGGGGSGTVNSGTSGQIAYYASTGTAVSGLNTTGSGNAVLATSPSLSTPTIASITGSTQCLHVNSSGAVTGTGSDCGTSGLTGANNTIACNNSGSSGSLTACTAPNAINVLNSATANAQTVSSYTSQTSDCNGEVTMTNASANTFTLAPNSTMVCAVGAIITVQQLGTGLTTIALGAGVSTQQGGRIVLGSLGGQYGWAQLQQVSTNVWQVVSQQLGNTKFTITGGTCSAAASTAGGNRGGTITLPSSGTVNACTIIVTPGGALQAANMWMGSMGDRNQLTVPVWKESANSSTTITFTLPGATAANDVLTFSLEEE